MAVGRKAKETVRLVEKILRKVRAVDCWKWVDNHKHIRLYITLKDGDCFFIVMSATSSDARARLNQVGDVKRELRRRGATI